MHLDCAWHGWLLAPQTALRRLSWRTLFPLTGGPVPAAVLRLVADPSTLEALDLPCLHMVEAYHARFWSRATRLARASFDRVIADDDVIAAHFDGFPALAELRVGRAQVPGSCVSGAALLQTILACRHLRALTLADTPVDTPVLPVPGAGARAVRAVAFTL